MSDYNKYVDRWSKRETYDSNTKRNQKSESDGECVVLITGIIVGLAFTVASCTTSHPGNAGYRHDSANTSRPSGFTAQTTERWKVDADGQEWGRNTSGEWVKDTRSMTEKMFGMSVLTEEEKQLKSQAYKEYDDAVEGLRGQASSNKRASTHCDFCGGDGRVPENTYRQSAILTPSGEMFTTWCRNCGGDGKL